MSATYNLRNPPKFTRVPWFYRRKTNAPKKRPLVTRRQWFLQSRASLVFVVDAAPIEWEDTRTADEYAAEEANGGRLFWGAEPTFTGKAWDEPEVEVEEEFDVVDVKWPQPEKEEFHEVIDVTPPRKPRKKPEDLSYGSSHISPPMKNEKRQRVPRRLYDATDGEFYYK